MYPLYPPPLPPPPLTLLLTLLTRPLDPWICQARCVVVGVWQLGGPPPERSYLFEPQWLLPVSLASPSPLMGEVRPLQPWYLAGLTLLPLPPLFVSRCGGGGGLLRSWGLPPIAYNRPCTKGVRAGLGVALPSPYLWSPPPTPACRALGAHTARGVPPLWRPGLPPPFLCLYAVLWDRALLRGSPGGFLGDSPPPPPPCMTCAGSARCLGGCPLLCLLVQGVPPLPCWYVAHW